MTSPKATKTTLKTPKTPRTPNKGDRFIPSRGGMDFEASHYNLMKENSNPNTIECGLLSPSKEGYNKVLAESLFEGQQLGSKILAFKNKAPAPKESANKHRVLYTDNRIGTTNSSTIKKVTRHIPSVPERILDAPNILNDYYLNLLEWNSDNLLAIALGETVYLWNSATGDITRLFESSEDNLVTSVSWAKQGGNILSVGTQDGTVQIWDVNKQVFLRGFKDHNARVGAMDWNTHILTTGSRDSCIIHNDVRVADYKVGVLQNHAQEICGLRWSPDGGQLASGSNDNTVCIWDNMNTSPKFTFTQHQAAVKALAWCPWQKDLLATGGGTNDRHIKFWNTNTGSLLNSIDTHSQVSALIWSKDSGCKEIVSGHGFSQNQLCVWKYPSLVKVADLTGHEQRILCMTQSPDGKTICSSSADETLRFWNIFEGVASKTVKSEPASNAGKVPIQTLGKSIR